MDRVGIIVPYRNRPQHLDVFKERITQYLESKGIDYEIIIVEQDYAKQFNRGMLLNIGFQYAKKAVCNYVVFHDIDMLPEDVDYSYSEIPLHLATHFTGEGKEIFEQYFGGVTLFPTKVFEQINGFSNKYWGWGYEDTDLLLRCEEHNVPLDTLKVKNKRKEGRALYFNGVNSYVKCKNVIDFNSNSTFFISFEPEKLIFNHNRESDEFTAFSVPGYDFAICYSSFSRYNFCTFDTSHNALFVNSRIKPAYRTNLAVVVNRADNEITVYQDGICLGKTAPFKRLFFYRKEPYFYLGVGKPDRELIPNFFRGYIDSFAYYDSILSDEEIKNISDNYVDLRTQPQAESLKIYYDAAQIDNYVLTDLSGNENYGKIYNCPIKNYEYQEYKEIKVPHRRRSTFECLAHEENGFLDNRWKDQATRWNQLRFHNEVCLNKKLINEDGLKDLQFVEYGKIRRGKITHVNIGI